MYMEERKIKILIERFMEGKTSLDEELQLQKYFCDTDKVSTDLEPYAEMFRYFAGGMPEKDGLLQEENIVRTHRKISIKRYIGWAIGAAAVVAAIITFTLSIGNNEKTVASLPSITQENGNGKSIQMVDSLNNSTDNAVPSTTIEQEKHIPQKSKTVKYRYKPAPPETLLANKYEAQADSIDRASQMMAEQELQRVEDLQQLTIGLIHAASAMREERISLMCSEEIY